MAGDPTPEENACAYNSKTDPILPLTAHIVSSYVANHTVTTEDLPALMNVIYDNLNKLRNGSTAPLTHKEPAVSVNNSVMPEYIVCLEDGKKLKMLKRHLKTAYNMTPEQYRERWNLPVNYPMVAPNYAKQRSRLAKEIGLGTARSDRKAIA